MYNFTVSECVLSCSSKVNSQAVLKESDRKLQLKEEELDELRRKLTQNLRDLENQLEEEKKQKNSAVSARKKMESEISELEGQLESESKGRDDAVKQYRKVQSQFKDSQLDAEDARKNLDQLSLHVKDLEKKVRGLEGDLSSAQEVKKMSTQHCTIKHCTTGHMLTAVHVHYVINFCMFNVPFFCNWQSHLRLFRVRFFFIHLYCNYYNYIIICFPKIL